MTDQSRLDSALKGPDQKFTPRSLAKFLAFSLIFGSLSAALSEITFGRTYGRPTQQSTQATSGSGSKADDEKDARLLEPGKPIKRELVGGNSHTYQIRLSAGQFLKVVVEQQDAQSIVIPAGGGSDEPFLFEINLRLETNKKGGQR